MKAVKFGKVTITWLSTFFHFLLTINNQDLRRFCALIHSGGNKRDGIKKRVSEEKLVLMELG